MENATHVANPVHVRAVQLVDFQKNDTTKNLYAFDAEGGRYTLTGEMLARYLPVPGDYLVTQDDGYQYINPREVFERKYQAIGQRVTFMKDSETADFLRNVAESIVSFAENSDMAVVVCGSYGGNIRVFSTNGGIDTIGVLRIGEQIMVNTIMPNGNHSN